MFPTMPARPSRALGAAVATALLLTACAVPPGDDDPTSTPPTATSAAPGTETPTSPAPPTGSSTETPTTGTTTSGAPVPGATTSAPAPTTATPSSPAPTSHAPTASATPTPGATELVTYSGTTADAAFTFQLPATWSVDGEFTDVGGTVTIVGADGQPLGDLSILMAWGAVCGPGCGPRPVHHLCDVPGSVPLSLSGPFVVRSVAMDLTGAPEVRNLFGWEDNVRLVTSLTDADVPVPNAMEPSVMHGLGQIETGVLAPNGITSRTVIFASTQDFATLAEAEEYARSEEHRQLQAMIASFRA